MSQRLCVTAGQPPPAVGQLAGLSHPAQECPVQQGWMRLLAAVVLSQDQGHLMPWNPGKKSGPGIVWEENSLQESSGWSQLCACQDGGKLQLQLE